MKLSLNDDQLIEFWLRYELNLTSQKLKFTKKPTLKIDDTIIRDSIELIDRISRLDNEYSSRVTVALCAIIWTYCKKDFPYIKDFFVLVLSRIGYPPSSIMIDDDYQNKSFSGINSIFDKLSISIHHFRNEIIIKDKTYLLTEFQKNIWTALNSNPFLGISAPTSAGKSFIILLKCIESLLDKDGSIVYIVPNLSLVYQVCVDFKNKLREFNISNCDIFTSFYEKPSSPKNIFVLTQEKAIAAFAQLDAPFENIMFLIVDEIQNIEKVANENDQRAKILYDVLIDFRNTYRPEKTIISGPRIENIGNLGITVFGICSEEMDTKGSPVVNLTYAISKNDHRYYLKLYSDIIKAPISIPIQYPELINGHGGKLYKEEYHKYLSHIIHCLGESSINIIFSPTTPQARKTAVALSNTIQTRHDKLSSLSSYIAETVHPKYELCKILHAGVAYHHGKTPPHVRRVLEWAVKNKMINNVVCTTTLMQGVNLPAQNVIIRNPNLYVKSQKEQKPTLTNYEIANLRGRAGRLMKDFIGRTYVLDENSFLDTIPEQELFKESQKELNPGYGAKYNDFKDPILNDLLDNTPPMQENKEYSFLLTYIRQLAIKYGEYGITRLKMVGIDFPRDIYLQILDSLSLLKIPSEICLKNRYWDPLDLERLYNYSTEITIPTSAIDGKISGKLMKLILFFKKYFPNYLERYFDIKDNDRLLQMYCINAEHWLRGHTLKSILNTSYFDDSDKIETAITRLQNDISFGLPMLLKPIYDIKDQESMFLRFIEMGAFKPITRRMIELNIPRETALMLSDKFFNGQYSDAFSPDLDEYIIDTLTINFDKLDHWNRVQLESLL